MDGKINQFDIEKWNKNMKTLGQQERNIDIKQKSNKIVMVIHIL